MVFLLLLRMTQALIYFYSNLFSKFIRSMQFYDLKYELNAMDDGLNNNPNKIKNVLV